MSVQHRDDLEAGRCCRCSGNMMLGASSPCGTCGLSAGCPAPHPPSSTSRV